LAVAYILDHHEHWMYLSTVRKVCRPILAHRKLEMTTTKCNLLCVAEVRLSVIHER